MKITIELDEEQLEILRSQIDLNDQNSIIASLMIYCVLFPKILRLKDLMRVNTRIFTNPAGSDTLDNVYYYMNEFVRKLGGITDV